MHDDSSINNSGGKSKLQRSNSSLSDSFRMAASVLQSGSGPSKRALNLAIPNLKLRDKEDYKKQPECHLCFLQFGRFGQHHCRICANAVCSSCSYSTINKERACDKCAYHYSDLDRQKFKGESLKQLRQLCAEYLALKLKSEEQLKMLDIEIPKQQDKLKEKRQSQQRAKKQNQRLEQLISDRKRLQEQIEKIRSS